MHNNTCQFHANLNKNEFGNVLENGSTVLLDLRTAFIYCRNVLFIFLIHLENIFFLFEVNLILKKGHSLIT